MDDELRPEYDFRALPVVARGPGRKAPHEVTGRRAQDVAEAFPIGVAKGQMPGAASRPARG